MLVRSSWLTTRIHYEEFFGHKKGMCMTGEFLAHSNHVCDLKHHVTVNPTIAIDE